MEGLNGIQIEIDKNGELRVRIYLLCVRPDLTPFRQDSKCWQRKHVKAFS